MTAKDIFDDLIFRAKNIHEFVIVTELPEDFCFNGVVPFDLTIKNNVITAKVWALTHEEALEKITEYIRLGY